MRTTKTSNLSAGKYSQVFSFVIHKKFALAKLGITDKMSFDWRKNGVYLQEKKTKYRMKYSPIEYIWLLLVKELRDFGLPIKSVINLKEFLVSEIDVNSLLLAISDGQADSEVILQEDLNNEKGTVQLENRVVNSLLTSMIISTLLKEKSYQLFIKKDGSCLIETIGEIKNKKDGFLSNSCLMIPFDSLVNQFLEKELDHLTDNLLNVKDNLDKVTETFHFKFLKNK